MPRVVRSNKKTYSLLTEMISKTGDVYDYQSSLYAWYKFETDISDTSSDTRIPLPDLSGNSRQLTPEAGVNADRPLAPTNDNPAEEPRFRAPSGFPTKSAEFSNDVLEFVDSSGNDDFSFGNASSNDDSAFSVAMWVKTTAADPTASDQYILGKYNFGANKREWLVFLNNGKPQFFLSSDGTNSNYISAEINIVLESDRWYHLVFTYDGSETKEGLNIYVDSIYGPGQTNHYQAGTYNGMTGESTAIFSIGNADDENTALDFIGKLAQVAIWSKELNAEAVRALHSFRSGIGEKRSGYLNIPPRLILTERDNKTGSYPSVKRTGDASRKGTHNIFYDDKYVVPFAKRVSDSFTLNNKLFGVFGFQTTLDEKKWLKSSGLHIRAETTVNEGGGTSKDGALVLAGPLTGSGTTIPGRWLRTRNKVRNPSVRFDAIVGPYNFDVNPDLSGLMLSQPTILETLKVQGSTDGTNFTTILTLSPFTLINFLADRNKVKIAEFGSNQYSRKRIKVVLGREDFKAFAGQEFYIRIIQDHIDNVFRNVWAIGEVEIDSYDQRNISYPLLLPNNSTIAESARSHIVATPHQTGSMVVAHGRTVSGLSDLHLGFTKGEDLTPFDDKSSFVNPDNVFYKQGTSAEVLPGFSSPVKSKTIIEIPLSCSKPTRFNFTKLTHVPDTNAGPQFSFNVKAAMTGAISFQSITGSMYCLHFAHTSSLANEDFTVNKGKTGILPATASIGSQPLKKHGIIFTKAADSTADKSADTIADEIISKLSSITAYDFTAFKTSHATDSNMKVVTIKSMLRGYHSSSEAAVVEYHHSHFGSRATQSPAGITTADAVAVGDRAGIDPLFNQGIGGDSSFRSGSMAFNTDITSSQMINQSDGYPDNRHKVMGYYNFRLNRWEKIAKGYGANNHKPVRLIRAHPLSPGFAFYSTGSGTYRDHLTSSYLPEAAVGFGPIGAISTGSNPENMQDQKLFDPRILNTMVRPIETFGFPMAPKFHATGSQTIKARDLGIQSPFLLEKVVLDFHANFQNPKFGTVPPGDAHGKGGPTEYSGTGSARFQHAFAFTPPVAFGTSSVIERQDRLNGSSTTYLSPLHKNFWIKIPTFFIMRQHPGRREVSIKTHIGTHPVHNQGSMDPDNARDSVAVSYTIPDSAKILSGADEASYVETDRDLITYGQMTVIYSGSNSADWMTANKYPYTVHDIINSPLRRDALTVIPMVDTANNDAMFTEHTGSFRIEFPCRTTGRYPAIHRLKVFGDTSDIGFFLGNQSTMFKQIEGLALGSPEHAGRSLGKLSDPRAAVSNTATIVPTSERVGASYIGIGDKFQPSMNEQITGSLNPPEIGTLDRVSPYLIMPDDDLIIGFQYPITSEPVYVQPFGAQKEFGMELLGDAKIRLIGSLLADSKEVHDGLNQNITQPSVHEMIGSELIQDQHDIATRAELEGSFSDNLNAASTTNPISRVGTQMRSIVENSSLGNTKLPDTSYITLVFANKKSYFAPRIDWTSIGGGKYHGDVIAIPRSSNRLQDILFEAALAPVSGSTGHGVKVGVTTNNSNGRIPMPGGVFYSALAYAVPVNFFGTNFGPGYWAAFNFFTALLNPIAWAENGVFAAAPPIPDLLRLINGDPVTTLTIGIRGADPSVEGQRILMYPSPGAGDLSFGTATDIDSDGTVTLLDSNELYDIPGGGLGSSPGGGVSTDLDVASRLADTPGADAGAGAGGLFSTKASGINLGLKNSLTRFFNLTDTKRAYLDGLYGNGIFGKIASEESLSNAQKGASTVGTRQTYVNNEYVLPRPKYYFSHKKFGNYADFISPGQDSHSFPTGFVQNLVETNESAVKAIFVTGSDNEGFLFRTYQRLAVDGATGLPVGAKISHNLSPTSQLTASFKDGAGGTVGRRGTGKPEDFKITTGSYTAHTGSAGTGHGTG